MGINEVILKIIELIAKFPLKRIAVIILLFTSLLLFFPVRATDYFGITAFIVNNRQWISFGFFLSIVCVVVIFGYDIILLLIAIKDKKRKAKIEKSIRNLIDKKINNLNDSEIAVLREFFIERTNIIKFPVNLEPIANLLNNHVLEKHRSCSENSIMGSLFDLEINDYAKTKLDYKLLGLPDINRSSFLENDKHNLINQRPGFILNLLKHKHSL